jgi:2-keto-4-pentenoate hydratase/2-oxohepta-3-ene-1,7-dioic acid hydratase in catechol pathway
MRLATGWVDNATVVYVGVGGDRFVTTDLLAGRYGQPWLAGVRDVRALLECDDDALERLGELLADVRDIEGQGLDTIELAAPVLDPKAFVCIGRNYPAHVAEGDAPMPEFPLLFSKFSNTLIPSGAAVTYPGITNELDYEGELAVVIGRRASRLRPEDAWGVIAGYTIVNDVSARDRQNGDLQWIRGKSLDGFAPLGPVVVTADEIPDVDQLRIRTTVNGEVRQDASCGEMHFKLPELLEFITAGITLSPGDLIATGTPAGVGMGFKPPRYLFPGDEVVVEIEPIGTLRTTIAAPSDGGSVISR